MEGGGRDRGMNGGRGEEAQSLGTRVILRTDSLILHPLAIHTDHGFPSRPGSLAGSLLCTLHEYRWMESGGVKGGKDRNNTNMNSSQELQ